jgi:hypothetical protein
MRKNLLASIRRITSALALLAWVSAILTGCSSSSDSDSTSSADDMAMSEAMDSCFAVAMADVATDAAVDDATPDALNYALRGTLLLCGTQAIQTDSIGGGYNCTDQGCYDKNDQGYTWTDTALRWQRNQ